MARLDINALTSWITQAAIQHPTQLSRALAAHAGVSQGTASKALRKLVDLQWLTRSGSRTRPVHAPGLLRQVVRRYPLAGLAEDTAWARDFAPYFSLAPHVQRMAHHAFCELVNNAIEHSEGSNVTVSLRQNPQQLQLLVSDNGLGLFDKLGAAFDLHDPILAMLELVKGKLTSQPEAHCGRGLFFTSRLADVFDIHANAGAFQHRSWHADAWHVGRPFKQCGTSIYAAFSLDTARTMESVLANYSLDGAGTRFERTVVPLKLLVTPSAGLESRAQARRVAARLEQFARAEIDFNDIADVGHSFADELFRVQSRRNNGLRLVPINMSPRVQAMVRSVDVAPASLIE